MKRGSSSVISRRKCRYCSVAFVFLLCSFIERGSSQFWAFAQGKSSNDPQAAAAVQRAFTASGGKAMSSIQDWTGEGTLTLYGFQGHSQGVFNVTVQRKGKNQVQRVTKMPSGDFREGSDGTRSWQSFEGGKLTSDAAGLQLNFIESQTVRSVAILLNYQTEGLTLGNPGKTPDSQKVDAVDSQGRKTTYFVDNSTSFVTRLEFVVGQATDMFSKKTIDRIDAYVFSDFRSIQGIQTPFKVQRFTDGFKAEEMQFTSVRYNTSLADAVFKP